MAEISKKHSEHLLFPFSCGLETGEGLNGAGCIGIGTNGNGLGAIVLGFPIPIKGDGRTHCIGAIGQG